MDLNTYQARALATDQVPDGRADTIATSLIVPMLGLAGETGQLLSEYKKHLRDGESHRLFKERVSEELGDLLWYLSNVASKFDLSLNEIAERNLDKVNDRWASPSSEAPMLDAAAPESERLPRRLTVRMLEAQNVEGRPQVRLLVENEEIGSLLRDNAYDPDGYRFHDVFHLAYACILGWSPNLRAFLKRKRKSQILIDEVEDGGRARVIEEGVAALVFDYARSHNFFEGITEIDYRLLRTIKSMTAHLEVQQATSADWQKAILDGYAVWRQVLENRGGEVHLDLDSREIRYRAAS